MSETTIADYEQVLVEHRRLVRELDVLFNGDGAAEQASLSDIVSQVRTGQLPLQIREKRLKKQLDIVIADARRYALGSSVGRATK